MRGEKTGREEKKMEERGWGIDGKIMEESGREWKRIESSGREWKRVRE